MRITNVYRYAREDGGETVSPIMPDVPYTALYRVVADDGNEISHDGVNWVYCEDSEYSEGWQERPIDDEITERDYQNALERLGVDMDEKDRA